MARLADRDDDYSGLFRPYGMQFSNASVIAGGQSLTNIIQFAEYYDADSGSLAYWTGAVGTAVDADGVAVAGALSGAPARVRAEARSGSVRVRIRALDAAAGGSAERDAGQIAESIARVTTEVWPGYAVPVEVDLHLMPQAESFALARPVNWRHGDPFVLSNFVYAGNPRWHVPAHELYHVLAIRWEIGAKARDATQLNLANAMEEIAAQLFELCGRLLAGGEAAPIANSNTINVNDRRIGNPPSAEEIGLLLSVLERLDQEPQLPDASPPGALFGATLANAYLQLVLGAGDVIREGSPQAESLLAACRRNLPDPLRIEDELRTLVPPR